MTSGVVWDGLKIQIIERRGKYWFPFVTNVSSDSAMNLIVRYASLFFIIETLKWYLVEKKFANLMVEYSIIFFYLAKNIV